MIGLLRSSCLNLNSMLSKFQTRGCAQLDQFRRCFSSKSTKDYYQLLGISQGATSKEIKAAYFEAAKDHHPDSSTQKFDGKFHDIQEAYKVLSSLSKRREYDAFRRTHVRPNEFDRMYGTRKRNFDRGPAGPYKDFDEQKYDTTPTTGIEKTVFAYAIVVSILGAFLLLRNRYYRYKSSNSADE